MKLAHSAPNTSRFLKFLKSGVALMLAMMLLLSVVFSVHFTWNAGAVANNNGQTKYGTVSEFQKARWKEIQSEVFNGVNLGADDERLTPAQIVSKTVQSGNKYFNWTNTGLSAWTGGTTTVSDSGRESHTYGDITANYYVYNVDTPKKLRYVLQNFNSLTGTYIKINITKDMDMGGQNGQIWEPINLQFCASKDYKKYLYLEGNGHTIYNLKIYNAYESTASKKTGCGLLATPPAFMVVKNMGFMSSMMLNNEYAKDYNTTKEDYQGSFATQSGLICAVTPQKMYMYNVHSSGGYYQNNDFGTLSAGGIGGLVGRKEVLATPQTDWSDMQEQNCGDTFFENCSTEKLYMYGQSHIGGFSSYMCTKSKANKYEFGEAFPETPEQYVFDTDFLSNITVSNIVNKSSSYPVMLKNCSSTDCELFSVGDDSGAFVSCGGGFVMEGCFTNNTLYAANNSGGFIGRVDSTNAPYIKDAKGDYAISSFFKDCYSAGIIEGKVAMGGFVGLENTRRSLLKTYARPTDGDTLIKDLAIDKRAAVYENCYSTAMVGMDYAGKYVGGFIGLDDNYNKSATITADGHTFTGNGSFYINCYAAGEVGNILTITDTDDATKALEDAYLKNEEGVDTKDDILDYYPTGGFAGVVGIDNYHLGYNKNTREPTGIFYNCYYDKQTTAMHEMAVGLCNTKTTYTIDGKNVSINNNKYSMHGITGLYTQTSTQKGVDGLTDMTYMDRYSDGLSVSPTWLYEKEYYPQLKRFMVSDMDHSDLSSIDSSCITSEIKASEFFIDSITNAGSNEYSVPVLSLAGAKNTDTADAQMAQIIRAYRASQASTATVLLDHWDIVMDTTTGALADEKTEWQAESRNKLTQYYIDKDTEEIIAVVKYYDSKGNELTEATFADRIEIVAPSTGKVIATLDSSDAESGIYYRNPGEVTSEHPNGVPVDSVYDIPDLSNAIDEWRITYGTLDAATYKFKIKEGLNKSQANTYGKGGYSDNNNISLNVPVNDCQVTIRFHYGELGSDEYYVIAEFYDPATGVTTTETIARDKSVDSYKPKTLYLRGSFNGWGTDSKMSYDGDMIYSYTYNNLEAGTYEFKIADEAWSEAYGQDGYGGNMLIKLSDTADVTFTFSDKTKLTTVTSTPQSNLTQVITSANAIDFEGISVIAPHAITGYNWLEDNKEVEAATAGKMTDSDNDGWYEATFTVNKTYYESDVSNYDKSYGYKIIHNAVDEGANKYFYLQSPANAGKTKVDVTFHYNVHTNESYVTTDDYPNKEDVYQHSYNVSYHVAGSHNLTGNNWLEEYDMTSGLMTYNASLNRYTKTYKNVPAGTHEFKVVGDGSWDSGVSYGDRKGENYRIELAKEADVTITFNHISGIITVSTNPVDAIVRTDYVVTGTGNLLNSGPLENIDSWDLESLVMTYDDENDLYYYEFEDVYSGDNYAYKIIEKGIDTDDDNITFRVDNRPGYQTVDLKITFDEATGKTDVYAYDPETGEDITDTVIVDIYIGFWSVLGDEELTGHNWGADIDDKDAAANDGRMLRSAIASGDKYNDFGKEGDIIWTKTYKDVEAPYDTTHTYAFKVVANGNWDAGVNYGIGGLNGPNIQFTVQSTYFANQNCDVEIIFNETEGQVYYVITPASFNAVLNSYHFDWYIYGEKGLTSVSSKKSDPFVYDTVRDITAGFEFTSGANSVQRGVSWNYNNTMNNSYDFESDIKFSLDYNVKGYDSTTEFDSSVVDLEVKAVKDNGEKYNEDGEISDKVSIEQLLARYYVDKFAPGKQWLTVTTVGYGYSDSYVQWKKNTVKYSRYQDALEAYNEAERSYLNALVGYEYNGSEITSSNLIEFCKYLRDSGIKELEENYASLVKTYGDIIELKAKVDSLVIEDPLDKPSIDDQQIYGKRHLRLIPTAYIEAGVDASVSVIQSDEALTAEEQNNLADNVVRYEDGTDDGLVRVYNTNSGSKVSKNYYEKYNFALSAGYLVTDKIGLGIYTNYSNQGDRRDQGIVKYGNGSGTLRDDIDPQQRIDNQFFAMSTVFTENPKYTDGYNANEGTYDNKLTVDNLVDQSVIGPAYTRGDNVAQTIVKVYKHNSDGTQSKVIMNSTPGAKGEYANNYQKWIGGTKQFTADDVGTYSVTFYWALSDGRYLQDTKEVVVKALTSGLKKAVDVEYTTEGNNKEITYTLRYVNDLSAEALNFAILDVLPFNGDERLAEDNNSDNIKTKMNKDAMTLKSISVSQSGGSQILGMYYTYDQSVRGYLKDGDTLTAEAAKKLGLSDGVITDKASNWVSVPGKNTTTNRYSNKTYTINADQATAIAISGRELVPGQAIEIKYTVVADLNASDFVTNNAFYDVIGIGTPDIRKSKNSNPVSTAVISRDLSGYAWWDVNENGVVDEEESFISNMEVALYKVNENNEYVEDKSYAHVVTGKDGYYNFENLPDGTYMVVFLGPAEGDKIYVDGNAIDYSTVGYSKYLVETNSTGVVGSRNLAKDSSLGYGIPSRIMPSPIEVYTGNLSTVNAINATVKDGKYSKNYQNAAFTFNTDYSVDIHKVNSDGEDLQGAEFVLEYLTEFQKTDSNGQGVYDDSGKPVMEEKWYTVYFQEENGKLENMSSKPMTYEELAGGKYSFSEDYELIGWINGANVENGDKFVEGKLTATFTDTSYINLKGSDSGTYFMTEGWLGEGVTSTTFVDSNVLESPDKLHIPAGTYTFTIQENSDGSISLSYVEGDGTGDSSETTESEDKYVYKFTTDELGMISVQGLEGGSYRLTEINSPTGYSKLTSALYFDLPYKVDASTDNTFVDVEATQNDEHLILTDAQGNKYYNHVTFEITDPAKQFILPATGFNGLFVTAIAGVALLAVAIVLFALSKKRKASYKH